MHEIQEWTLPVNCNKKAVQNDADRCAMKNGEYHDPLEGKIEWIERVSFNSKDEAFEWLDKYTYEKGRYWPAAVKYTELVLKPGAKRRSRVTKWALHFEYHV